MPELEMKFYSQRSPKKGYSWETPPAPVPEAEIAETVTSEVLVIGGGISGLAASARCADKGLQVVTLDKNEKLRALAGQIAAVVVKLTAESSPAAEVMLGFGALAAMAMFLVLFFLNRAMLKKGIEPVYRPNDIKRREMLRRYRSGELDLDRLPLPVLESEEEREERLKALEEALKAEEEGKEL